MDTINYKAAYERQKLARARAEDLLEDRSRELFEANQSLQQAYTKLKNQKQQLMHQEKLASIGQLAAGVAHEINNPVGFVKSNLSTMGRYCEQIREVVTAYQNALSEIFEQTPEGFPAQLQSIVDAEERIDIDYLLEDVPRVIDESIDGTRRITKIVQGLKTFSRVDSDQMETMEVGACLKNTLKLVENDLKYKAEIKTDIQPLPTTMGYPGSFSQVVLNLLVNASQAIEDFGTVELKASADETHIRIQVSDDGCGMDEETVNRIFDPFFTTKPVGEGTGLGLSISLGIVKKHGGQLSVDSTPGCGTTFTIELPVICPA